MMRLGSTVDIFAIPHKALGVSGIDVSHIIDLSGLELPHFKSSMQILISKASSREVVHALNGRLDGLEDLDNAIKFSVKMTRPLVRSYMEKVRDHLAGAGITTRRSLHGTNGVVFMGMMFRDFRYSAYMLIMLANIARYKSFPVYRTAAVQFGRQMAVDRFSVAWANRPGLEAKVGIESLDLRELILFSTYNWQEFVGTPKTPYMKALANHSYLYSGGSRFTLNNLVWCLASIEALLNPGGRSVRAQIEDRLRVLFEAERQSYIISKFKGLYTYRSNLTHGALNIPFYLHDRGNIPFLDTPFEEAEFALALNARLLQICFERKLYELRFRLSLP